ncbi:hypothetical protein J6590_028622 [Homalodisca vitripennis]|nr:hypothetical protein J6590_028622 [Homalodisca vitripennis]
MVVVVVPQHRCSNIWYLQMVWHVGRGTEGCPLVPTELAKHNYVFPDQTGGDGYNRVCIIFPDYLDHNRLKWDHTLKFHAYMHESFLGDIMPDATWRLDARMDSDKTRAHCLEATGKAASGNGRVLGNHLKYGLE